MRHSKSHKALNRTQEVLMNSVTGTVSGKGLTSEAPRATKATAGFGVPSVNQNPIDDSL
jgi:hypothetical protein